MSPMIQLESYVSFTINENGPRINVQDYKKKLIQEGPFLIRHLTNSCEWYWDSAERIFITRNIDPKGL